MALRALLGAALAPPVPAWPTHRLHQPPPPVSTPAPDAARLQAWLLARLARVTLIDPWALPWAPGAQPTARRVLAAVAGPVDDYGGPFPTELLPAAQVPALLAVLSAAPAPMGVCGQWEAALSVVGEGRPLAAALLLHLTLRVLARGRERRAGVQPWLDARLAWGAAVAPLGPGGDPLGEGAAYWAGMSAGLAAAWAKSPAVGRRTAGRALHLAVAVGPEVRAALHGLRGRPQRGGDHRGAVRMGLRHGLALGVAVRRQLVAGRGTQTAPAAAAVTANGAADGAEIPYHPLDMAEERGQ